MNVRDLAVQAVVVKTIKDVVTTQEKATKDALADLLDVKDRKSVVLADGTDVGTVTYTQGRTASAWKVTDPTALLGWARDHQPDAVVEALAAWFTSPDNLSSLVQKSGEVPDGVEFVESTGDPYITVRQTPEQKDATLAALTAGSLTDTVRTVLELGA